MRQAPRIGSRPGDDPGAALLADLSPYLRHCGDVLRPAWVIGERKLLDHLLVYIGSGHGRFRIGEQQWQAQAGDLFWIPPDTPHHMQGDSSSMHCCYLHFDLVYRGAVSHWDFSIPPGTLDLREHDELMHPLVCEPAITDCYGLLRAAGNHRIGRLMRECCAEAARAQPYAALSQSGLLLMIISEILRNRHRVQVAEADNEHLPLIEEAERFLSEHCHEDLSLRDLAAMAGLSVSHFRRLFTQHLGRSPREHLRYVRIQRAKQLMIGSDLSLGTVASRCGFANVHSFSRAFQAVQGLPPSRWRRYGEVTTRVEGRTTPYESDFRP
ncbi:MAG: helix-turn-helix domain-containing protein [Planctomycetota bacterium]